MQNRDPVHNCSRCDDEDGARYLGDRDQIENLLGFTNMTEVRKETREQISLQPHQQINSVLAGAK